MRQLKRVTAIINLKSLFVAGLAVLSMLACQELGLEANFPLTLVATAVVFPIVFSIIPLVFHPWPSLSSPPV